MSNLQNINLQTEQKEDIFANRKDKALKVEKNEQGALWSGFENINPQNKLTSSDDIIFETQDDYRELPLFPKITLGGLDVLLYDRQETNKSKDQFFHAFFERNINNKSTKLLFQRTEDVFGGMNSYNEYFLEAHLLFDKILVISRRYYQCGVRLRGEGDIEELENETRDIIKIIKYPTLPTITQEISHLTVLCEQSLFKIQIMEFETMLNSKDRGHKKIVDNLNCQNLQLKQNIAEKDEQIALLQQLKHVIAEQAKQIELLQAQNNKINIMFNLALDQLMQPKGLQALQVLKITIAYYTNWAILEKMIFSEVYAPFTLYRLVGLEYFYCFLSEDFCSKCQFG